MAPEVAQGQVGDRLFAVERTRLWHPLLQQRVGELLTPSRPASHQAVQLRTHDEMREALALGRNAACTQDLAELASSQVAPARERRGEQSFGASGNLVI